MSRFKKVAIFMSGIWGKSKGSIKFTISLIKIEIIMIIINIIEGLNISFEANEVT